MVVRLPVFPKKKKSRSENKEKEYDREIYRLQRQVENLFARLKALKSEE